MAGKIKPKMTTTMCFCVRDGREYPVDKFYEHKNKEFYPKGYIPYCKECCEDIVKYYLKKTGTLESAMWYTCAFLDIPFIKKVYENMVAFKNSFQVKSGKTDSEYNIFNYYYEFLWGNKSAKKALETWETFADSDVDYKDIQGVTRSNENIKAQIEKLELDWGYQESEEDYKFLTYLYDKYTNNIEFENPQQEDLYRDLCLARLEKRKAEQGKVDTDITKIQSRILTLMNKLKLDEFDSTKPKTVSEQLIFAKIPMVEEHDSWELYNRQKKYENDSQVRRYLKDLVLRPILNFVCDNKNYNVNIDDVTQYDLDNGKQSSTT